MKLNFYRFDAHWEIARPKGAVFDALADPPGYPQWWPDYRAVVPVAENTHELTVRATLPYKLIVTNELLIQDPDRGHLRFALGKDIVGWIDYVVRDEGAGRSSVRITQECKAAKGLLRLLAPVAKPAFRHNHTLMMRRGLVALEKRLANADG